MVPASAYGGELHSLCSSTSDAEPTALPQASPQSACLHRSRVVVASLLLLGGVAAAYSSCLGAAAHPWAADLRGGQVFLATTALPGYIFIVRHAERDTGLSCLNTSGWVRAGNLSSGLFLDGARPERIFAYNYNGLACERCLQTALPLATALQVDVNHSFPRPGKNCLPPRPCHHADAEAAEAMLAALDETGGPIMAVWESYNTFELLKHLGVQDAPEWPRESCAVDYDRMYKVRYTRARGRWEYASYENLTEGMPCLPQRLASKAEMVGLPRWWRGSFGRQEAAGSSSGALSRSRRGAVGSD